MNFLGFYYQLRYACRGMPLDLGWSLTSDYLTNRIWVKYLCNRKEPNQMEILVCVKQDFDAEYFSIILNRITIFEATGVIV